MSNASYANNSFIGDDGKSSSGRETYEKQRSLELSTKLPNGFQASDDYEPYAHRKVAHPLTNTETFVHLLKVALGTGIFAMPNAFKHSGYLVGFLGTVVLGSVATYCVHMLVNIHYELCKSRKVPSMIYPHIAEAALLTGPKCFHRFAPHMVHVINAFLLTYQFGSACIYVVFISTNLKALIDVAFGADIEVRLVMVIILIPLILINWVRKLKYLAPLATLGNIITLGSFAVICYYIFSVPLTFEGKNAVGSLSDFPLFFGTVVFALEAIGVIMPLENEMQTPKDFRGPTGILNRAMCLIIALYIGLGFIGYIRYGDNVAATITINLPKDEFLAQAAKGMIALGVYVTHAIACYVGIDIAWTQYLYKRVEKSSYKTLWEYVLRTGVVLLTFILAVAIPNLDLFISLIGALTLSTLGILFPPFLECMARWNTTHGYAKTFMIFKNVVIGCIGLAGFVIGTSLSLKDIIKTYVD